MKRFSNGFSKRFIKPREKKFNNKIEWHDGKKFDSAGEASYYRFLKMQQLQGKLKILALQPKVYLTDARILYKPDFLVEYPDGKKDFIDFKGMKTAIFQLKKRLWEFYGEGNLILIKYNRKSNSFEIMETIVTKRQN